MKQNLHMCSSVSRYITVVQAIYELGTRDIWYDPQRLFNAPENQIVNWGATFLGTWRHQ